MTPIRTAALAALLLWVADTASAQEPEPGARPRQSHAAVPADPVSLITGSQDFWSVSQTNAGCYLLSPQRKKTSRIAIGRNPVFGLGVFAVDIAIAIPRSIGIQSVTIQTDTGPLAKDARIIGAGLLFMPMSEPEVEQALRTLTTDGRIWLVIRGAWLSHAGLDVSGAITTFHKHCDDTASQSPPVVVAAAPVGSKSASAPR